MIIFTELFGNKKRRNPLHKIFQSIIKGNDFQLKHRGKKQPVKHREPEAQQRIEKRRIRRKNKLSSNNH
jgi:hypothetical protein